MTFMLKQNLTSSENIGGSITVCLTSYLDFTKHVKKVAFKT